jgi:pimeloyl-ACP methyl ester carboxylesterase
MTTVDVSGVPVTVTEQGTGRPVLLLHGGGGPQTVLPFAALLAEQDARVVTPVHPGFQGTPRPPELDSIAGLGRLYDGLLDALDLRDVLVVGNSIGGWTAAELALLGNPRLTGAVLVDAVGLALPDDPTVDFFSLTPPEIIALSWADPALAPPMDPAAMSPEQQQVLAGNRAALEVYGGQAMADPTLLGRLPGIAVRTLVVWGAADRIAPPSHGRAYADAIPGARLEILDEAGHLPQLEAPDALAALVRQARA